MKTELISEAIQAAAANHFHSDAFVLEDGTRTSFAQVSARSAALADAPRAIGATPDDRIAFAVPRGVSGMTGFIGISSVAVCCPFNPRLKSDEFVAFFRSFDIATLVVSATDS